MPTSDYTPTVADVAAFLRQRTVNDYSNEVGTFDATTRPTAVQAQQAIDSAVAVVSAMLGADIPLTTWASAKYLVSLRAAMHIELSYFNNEIRPDKSAYRELLNLWELDSAAIVEAVRQAGDGVDQMGVADDAEGALFAFPEDKGGLTGWETQW